MIATVALTLLTFLAAEGPPRRNVVVFRTDDMRVSELAVTPNVLNRIAGQGVTFSNSFVTVSLCSPSRASFLSGQYTHNHHVFTNSAPLGGYGAFDHTNSLATWLQAAGYVNVHFGKYMNGYSTSSIPPGWDEWYTVTGLPISGSYYNYTLNENGATVSYGSDPEDYLTDVLTRKAIEFLRNRASTSQPFFLLVDLFAPHGAPSPDGYVAYPAPRHEGIFSGYAPTLPPSFNEADMSDKPAEYQGLPSLTLQEQRSIVRHIRKRREALLSVDEAVGKIMDALSQIDMLDDTFVIFTSDNGFQLGEHRIFEKNTFYEDSLRVPLFARGPGIQAGLVMDEIVANIDIAPTLVEIAGATAGRVMDGRSLVPLMLGQQVAWRSNLLVDRFFYTFFPGTLRRPSSGVRYRGGLYAEYDYGGDGVVDERELYDMQADPFQLQSQHADPSRIQEMRRRSRDLGSLKACSGASCW